MSKVGSHYSFGHLKRKLWPKEGQFDSRPQKVVNQPDLFSFRGRTTYHWKALDESYNFASDRTSTGGLLAKLWGSKIVGVLVGGISGLPFGSPKREKPFGCRLRG